MCVVAVRFCETVIVGSAALALGAASARAHPTTVGSFKARDNVRTNLGMVQPPGGAREPLIAIPLLRGAANVDGRSLLRCVVRVAIRQTECVAMQRFSSFDGVEIVFEVVG